ncbi:Aminotran_1_2 domain-containing protein [Meloidogyne graminicola]|uniref:Aminotran_1_2 domain-containing protein n=1 Tax=Meloidogyne graminicola TaxID=189291 RepID=A0A8T0A0J7_9BILA|nr:Aminotran_1_2 domain-containing protein [Meloidogyne graminicola]
MFGGNKCLSNSLSIKTYLFKLLINQRTMSKFHSKHIPSKIAREAGDSIWVEFVTLATETNAVNLGQGFTNGSIPLLLSKHLNDVSKSPERIDNHQYTRGYGHQRLVNVLSKLYSLLLGVKVNSQTDILVTVGAYLSLYYAFIGWLNPGDEVIIFEPAYDSYVSQIKMAGAIPIPIVLELDPNANTSAGYRLNIDVLKSKITKKTKMLVLNNPNNPTGKLYTRTELEQLAKIAVENDLIVLTASLPGMFERTITIGSAGKVFSATGWKTGWSIAPKWLLDPMKKVHENCVFACPTPIQEALARSFEEELALWDEGKFEKSYLKNGIITELLPKRDLLAKYLQTAGFKPIIPDAGYFMIADFSHLDGSSSYLANKTQKNGESIDYEFCRWLCREKKLAGIPPSAFYSPQNREGNDHYIRLCFFKKDETLQQAIKILGDSFETQKE